MTGLLLDTHALLWLITDDSRLSEVAKEAYLTLDAPVSLSLASVWEIAIKVSLGKLAVAEPLETLLPRELRENAIRLLPIEMDHCLKVARLPFHHRDPFDRLIAAQALHEGLPLLSRDPAFDAYGVERIW